MATKLNYQMLQRLVDPASNHSLKVVKDPKNAVTRFGNDTSEIQLGQTVPFVANMSFVVTELSYARLKGDIGKIVAVDETLFSINNRAEIVTELEDLEIDADSVARWIADHFEITFRVRGVDRSPFRPYRREQVDVDQFATIEPWLQEINTLAVRGEVIDIDFDVRAKLPATKRAVSTVLLSKTGLDAEFDQATVKLELEIEGKYAAVTALKNGRYWLALQSDEGPDLKLRFKVDTVTPTDSTAQLLLAEPKRARKEPAAKAKNQPEDD